MKYHSYLDPISTLNLSTRSHNALKTRDIHKIADLLSCSKDDIKKIRNLGVKSIEEIFNIIDSLNTYELYAQPEKSLSKKQNDKTFVGYDGLKYIDIPIEDLQLSVRAYNCLKLSGNNYYSQLIYKLQEELLAIPNMGKKTLLELEQIIKTVQPLKYIGENNGTIKEMEEIGGKILISINDKINIKPIEFFNVFGKVYLNYSFEQDTTFNNKNILKNRMFMRNLYEDKYIKSVINEYILNVIKENHYGCDENYIFDRMPECFKCIEILNESLNDLLTKDFIDLLYDDRFVAIYDSFVSGAKEYMTRKEYDVIIERTQGKTLEEVGEIKEVTRERIRQIEAKAIRKLNNQSVKFEEDMYSDVLNRYVISREDFKIAFNDVVAYQYLALRYGNVSEKENLLKKPLEDILYDESIPMFFKRACEKAIYKNYVKIGNEYIKCTRSSISNYVLKSFAFNDLSFDEYCSIYFSILKDIDKLDDPKLSIMERGYEHRLANSYTVLWKYGKKLRYYNIESYDFTELLSTLNLNKYENIEYSTLKFINLYPELMKAYDIRDEYELHNLLKKICKSNEYPIINFKRMPNIEFGNANRDNQVLQLLTTLAPISNNEFAQEYEDEYGVAANTVLANYMESFDQYFYNGFYKIDFLELPEIVGQELKEILTEDFYMLSTIRDIYQEKFPEEDKKLLNPLSLKSIGFKVYSNYAITDIYNSATEYFNIMLTKGDTIDLEKIPSSVKETISYTVQFYKLKSDYEIIEFIPNKIINFRRLDKVGITKEMLNKYCEDVLKFVGYGKYFTLFSIKEEGFTHELDDLGFDDWFYTSILIEDKANISYQKIGGNKVMLTGNFNIRFEEFLEYIVFNEEVLFIDLYDLTDKLQNKYNVNMNRNRLIDTVKNSSMYYDPISEKVFADYDTYYEVI